MFSITGIVWGLRGKDRRLYWKRIQRVRRLRHGD